MGRIGERFKELAQRGEGAFISFITMGDPSPEETVRLCETLVENGADMLELGLPYSDPVADGLTIQASYDRALRAGMTPSRGHRIVEEVRAHTQLPLILLTYYNPLLRQGLDRALSAWAEAGVDGVIVPDLPVEEASPLLHAAERCDLEVIFLVAPTTRGPRLERILQAARGFIYLVSLLGVTGARETLSSVTKTTVARISKVAKGRVPIAVGFGISKPEHVSEVLRGDADGVIVGSSIIDTYTRLLPDSSAALREVAAYTRRMKAATRRRGREP